MATRSVRIGNGATVGDGVTFIAGTHLLVDNGATLGRGTLLFGDKRVDLMDGAAVASGSMLSRGRVDIHEDARMGGLVYAEGAIQLDARSLVNGAVVSQDEVRLHHHAHVRGDCGAVDLPPGLWLTDDDLPPDSDPVSCDPLCWSVAFLGADYDPVADTTSFVYGATSHHEPLMERFVLGLSGCPDRPVTALDPADAVLDIDTKSGIYGALWFVTAVADEEIKFTLTLPGQVAADSGVVLFDAGPCRLGQVLPAPSCPDDG